MTTAFALLSIVLSAAHIGLRGPLVDANHEARVTRTSVSLVAADGYVEWRWHAPAASTRTWFLAAGDLNGDASPEIVVAAYTPLLGAICGVTARSSSALYVLDGQTGHATRVGPRLADSCFDFGSLVYPMDQWMPGSVSIANQTVVAFPVYATEGYVQRGSTVQRLVFPSTPRYDQEFPQCHDAPGNTQCYIPNSHIANVVFIPGGLFALTSERAVVYAHGRPVDDLTWTSGTTSNGGRNKGFLFTFVDQGRRYAELIGGCTVANEQRAIRLHELPTGVLGNCSIHHHLEWFALDGLQITAHANRYYGYIGTDGYLVSRLEAPAPANGPLGGRGTHWTVFNRFDGSDWHLTWLPDPAQPDRILEEDRTYAWGMADLNGDGKAELLATRGAGYFLPWRFDVLERRDAAWRTLARVPRLLPTLLQYPDTGSEHFSDGRSLALPGEAGDSRYGVRTSGRKLLVETQAGKRFWLRLARSGR
jgi:hypothetical protein